VGPRLFRQVLVKAARVGIIGLIRVPRVEVKLSFSILIARSSASISLASARIASSICAPRG